MVTFLDPRCVSVRGYTDTVEVVGPLNFLRIWLDTVGNWCPQLSAAAVGGRRARCASCAAHFPCGLRSFLVFVVDATTSGKVEKESSSGRWNGQIDRLSDESSFTR